MSFQPRGQTLQATALVHEAYMRLLGDEKRWESRRHFFNAAAEAMRHILIDRARRRLRTKHGENVDRIPLDEIEITSPAKEEIILQLDEALEKLAQTSPEQAEIMKLRFFAGFTETEVAHILNLSERSVHLDSQRVNSQLVLSWTNVGFNLQSAPALTGTFTNLLGATSPYTNSFSGPRQSFRLAAP